MYIIKSIGWVRHWFIATSTNNPNYHWKDHGRNRWQSDIPHLAKFNTFKDAEKFLEDHPEFEEEWAATIQKLDPSSWNGTIG